MPVSGININIQLRVSEEDKAGDEQKQAMSVTKCSYTPLSMS